MQAIATISTRDDALTLCRTWEGDQIAACYREAQDRLGRRVFNTHLRWDMMPQGRRARYLYVCRNAKDACVSFYHHLTSQASLSSFHSPLDGDGWLTPAVCFVVGWRSRWKMVGGAAAGTSLWRRGAAAPCHSGRGRTIWCRGVPHCRSAVIDSTRPPPACLENDVDPNESRASV